MNRIRPHVVAARHRILAMDGVDWTMAVVAVASCLAFGALVAAAFTGGLNP
jgi:hypothetical protein